MNSYREQFLTWWESFTTAQHNDIAAMMSTVENSPYHREANVMEHTRMVVDWFIQFTDDVKGNTWSYSDVQGAVACAFHDYGKPASEEEFFSETLQRTIRSYKGHEIMSAGMFMDVWCTNQYNVRDVITDIDGFYNTWVMIAYHLPYNLTGDKLRVLRKHLLHYRIHDVFERLLLSDTHGRIQDEREKEINGCYEWINNLYSVDPFISKNSIDNGDVQMMVGVSGSGKSTYTQSMDCSVYSYDGIRHALFPDADSYRDIFEKTNAYFDDDERDLSLVHRRLKVGAPDKKYGQNELFFMTMKNAIEETPKEVVLAIDNTSLSRKYRRVINAANHKARKNITAVMFIRSLNELYENEESRDEFSKRGKDVINRLYYKYYPVLLGEADDIKLIPPKDYV